MQKEFGKLTGKRIGVFGKGGAGKSTVVVLFAEALQELGCEVCVLDADSTNIGLPEVLGIDVPKKTLLDFYGGMIFSGGQVTCPVDDPTSLRDAEINLDTLSNQYYSRSEQGIIFLSAGKIGNQGPGAGCDGPISKIARDIKIRRKDRELITLIDFKAGFEDSARGAITSLDCAIVVVDPTTASVEIAENMRDMVLKIQADDLPATAHLEDPVMVELANRIFRDSKIQDVFFILNKVPNAEIEDYLREKLLEKEIKPLGVIHEDPTIPTAWLKGKPLKARVVMGEVQLILEKLVSSIDGCS
jgi:CO dehydrogenase nickel-insertion accessory protein CooC1